MIKKLLFTIALSTSYFGFSQFLEDASARYTFNQGDATDEIGTNDGTVIGATITEDRFGAVDHAYSFNGTSDYIDFGGDAALKPSTGSISLWINMEAISDAGSGHNLNTIIQSKNAAVGSYFEAYSLYINRPDKKIISLCTETGTTNQSLIYSTIPVVEGDWYHIVTTFSDDSLSLYINGVLDSRIEKGYTSTYEATLPVTVGAGFGGSNERYFQGKIDDIGIYDFVLSEKQIDSLYNVDPLSITEEIATSVVVYPNPSSDWINIETVVGKTYLFEIYDALGNKVLESKENLISIRHLAKGTYYLRSVGETETMTQRFIKN